MSNPAKQIVVDTDTDEWGSFSDPYIWYHEGEVVTLETVRNFSEDEADGLYGEWAKRNFPESDYKNPAYMMGGVRLKIRGIPYYECDVLRIEWIGGRVFLTLPHGTDANEQSHLGDFGYELSKLMSEAAGYDDFEQVLDDADIGH